VVQDVACVATAVKSARKLSSALLILHGRCLKTKLLYSWEPGKQPEQGAGNLLFTLKFLKKCGWNVRANYDIGVPGSGFVASGEEVYCLYLGDDESYDHSWLLTLRCLNPERREFERIALLETFNICDLALGSIEVDVFHVI
jgi:hypothetical protein